MKLTFESDEITWMQEKDITEINIKVEDGKVSGSIAKSNEVKEMEQYMKPEMAKGFFTFSVDLCDFLGSSVHLLTTEKCKKCQFDEEKYDEGFADGESSVRQNFQEKYQTQKKKIIRKAMRKGYQEGVKDTIADYEKSLK